MLLCTCGVTALRSAEPPVDPAAAMAAAMEMLGKMAEKNAGAAAAVDPKAMRALLPDKEALPGFKRTSIASESNAAMGFRVNTAKAEYRQLEGEGTLEIQFLDIGGLPALAKAARALQEVDKETEHGFQRTALCQGFKSEEEYDGETKRGSIKLIAGERVAVEIQGRGVSFATIKAVADKLDLKQLAALKAVAATAETGKSAPAPAGR
jgi:hypothetical protein